MEKFTDQDLQTWFNAGVNVIIKGKHGIGKTERVCQLLERNGLEKGKGYQYLSAPTMDPWVDFVGIPEVDKKKGTLKFLRPEYWSDDLEILVFDEFNRAPSKVRNACMELIQFKSTNGKKFPKLRAIWAMINPDDNDDNAYEVEPLDPAQLDRFQVQVEFPYEVDEAYFVEKFRRFGQEHGANACQWWRGLSKEGKDLCSPRRLDYALEYYFHTFEKTGQFGNMSHVLDKSLNVSDLEKSLDSGHILTRFNRALANKDVGKLTEILNNDNNFATCMAELLRTEVHLDLCVPLIEPEKFASTLMSDEKFENYVRQKVTNEGLYIDFLREMQRNVENDAAFKKSCLILEQAGLNRKPKYEDIDISAVL